MVLGQQQGGRENKKGEERGREVLLPLLDPATLSRCLSAHARLAHALSSRALAYMPYSILMHAMLVFCAAAAAPDRQASASASPIR